MILRTGVDMLEIERLHETVDRHGEHFLARIFTAAEQAECGLNYPSLASRFAAKEAVSKALGTGIGDVGSEAAWVCRAAGTAVGVENLVNQPESYPRTCGGNGSGDQ